MKSLDLNQTVEPPAEFIFRGRRFLGALLVAIILCVVGFACCFAALFVFSPHRVLERTVNQMVWIWPALMLLVLPFALLVIERKQGRKAR
jgi:hypothetical protein